MSETQDAVTADDLWVLRPSRVPPPCTPTWPRNPRSSVVAAESVAPPVNRETVAATARELVDRPTTLLVYQRSRLRRAAEVRRRQPTTSVSGQTAPNGTAELPGLLLNGETAARIAQELREFLNQSHVRYLSRKIRRARRDAWAFQQLLSQLIDLPDTNQSHGETAQPAGNS